MVKLIEESLAAISFDSEGRRQLKKIVDNKDFQDNKKLLNKEVWPMMTQ